MCYAPPPPRKLQITAVSVSAMKFNSKIISSVSVSAMKRIVNSKIMFVCL